MNVEDLKLIQLRVKFCMKHRIPVVYRGAEYTVSAMLLRCGKKGEFYYTVELADVGRTDSTVTAGLEDIEWPTEGGGFTLVTDD